MPIKALETTYNGYRFRSRLEARWAVFFDAMRLEYRYEEEGFLLDDDRPYLPDFWFPGFQTWVEIKPVSPSPSEIQIAYSFAIEERPYFIFYGVPGSHGCFWIDDVQEWDFPKAYFARCRKCASGIYMVDDERGGSLFVPCEPSCTCEKYPYMTEDIQHAYDQARGARFEPHKRRRKR